MKLDNIEIKGITCDSRKVQQGYAFVAIKGQNYNGNDYIDMAIENGAAIIFTEQDVDSKQIPIVKTNDARIKLTELLNKFYDYPSEKMKLIGVTGTNGKTTTTYIINEIFKHSGYKTGLIGTLGIKIDDKFLPSSLTTPDPEVLFLVLDKMVKENVEVVIMEVSSHGLKFNRINGLDFDVAIHTNIDRDHMNLHKTFEDYLQTKKILFDSLVKNKLAILNIDDVSGVKLIQNNTRALVATYGLDNRSSITASSLEIDTSIKFNFCLQRGITTIDGEVLDPFEFPVQLNLMGRHNIYNALAAITTALYFGIDAENIRRALISFKGVSRRLEKVYEGEYLVIDDFSHNPGSYGAVLETIQALNYNKLIIISTIRGNRGVEVNEENAKIISTWYRLLGKVELIISLSNDTISDGDKVIDEEIAAVTSILKESNIEYLLHDTIYESIKVATNKASRGDIILLLGAQGMNKGKQTLYDLLDLQEFDVI